MRRIFPSQVLACSLLGLSLRFPACHFVRLGLGGDFMHFPQVPWCELECFTSCVHNIASFACAQRSCFYCRGLKYLSKCFVHVYSTVEDPALFAPTLDSTVCPQLCPYKYIHQSECLTSERHAFCISIGVFCFRRWASLMPVHADTLKNHALFLWSIYALRRHRVM